MSICQHTELDYATKDKRSTNIRTCNNAKHSAECNVKKLEKLINATANNRKYQSIQTVFVQQVLDVLRGVGNTTKKKP